ncbi:MAG: GNAT family N-acetyltransferase [Asticcacaulis sp.]
MQLDIREVGPEAFDDIWPILQEVLAGEDSYPQPADFTLDEGRAFWFAPGARVYNVHVDGELVASRYIVPNKPGLGAHVCNTGVIIKKSWRGKGLGRRLNDFAVGKARELGFRAIQLNFVVSTNAASIRICRDNGFEIVGTLPEAFHYKRQRYVDAYVMFRKL